MHCRDLALAGASTTAVCLIAEVFSSCQACCFRRKEHALDVADTTTTKAFAVLLMAIPGAHNGPEGAPGSKVQRGIVRLNGNGEVWDDLQTARRVYSATERSTSAGLGVSCNSCVASNDFACTNAERFGQGLLLLSPEHWSMSSTMNFGLGYV